MKKIINLLPTGEQKFLGYQRLYGFLRAFVFWSAASYVLLIGGLAYWRSSLAKNLDNVGYQIQLVKGVIQKQDNEQIKTKIQQDNNIISDYNSLAAGNLSWSRILEGFAQLVPGDVIITTFNASAKTGKIDISGVAANRDSEAVTLRNNLASSPLFKNVNLPFENLQKATNVNFNYTFYLSDSILKPSDITNQPAKTK